MSLEEALAANTAALIANTAALTGAKAAAPAKGTKSAAAAAAPVQAAPAAAPAVAPVAPVAAPATARAPTADTAPPVTPAQIKAAADDLTLLANELGQHAKAVAILGEFGVKKMTEMPQGNIPEFHNRIKAAIAAVQAPAAPSLV